jgi:hypothetical protein
MFQGCFGPGKPSLLDAPAPCSPPLVDVLVRPGRVGRIVQSLAELTEDLGIVLGSML